MEKIPDLYQVKFRIKGKKRWIYGIVSTFGKRAESLWNDFKMIEVEDVILPKVYHFKYDDAEIIPIAFDYPCETSKYVDEQLKKAEKKSKAIKTGLKGKLFHVNIADGFAYYLITEEKESTVKIEWRGFCMDRYYDQYFQSGGEFSKERISSIIEMDELMNSFF